MRPFGPRAPWNIPAAGLPLRPNGSDLVDLLLTTASSTPGKFNIALNGYTMPVYDARKTSKEYKIRLRPNGLGNLDGLSVPWNEAWRPSLDGNSQAVVVNPNTGQEWDLFRALAFNGVLTASAASLLPESYWTREVGWEASGEAGLPFLAMLVRPDEVAAGLIDHALSLTVLTVSSVVYSRPATRLPDPYWASPGMLPIGTRFVLNMTDNAMFAYLNALPGSVTSVTRSSLLTIITALRTYGFFVTGRGDGCFLFEDVLSAHDAWDTLGLYSQTIGDKILPRDLLDGLLQRDQLSAIVPGDQYALGA
jgi:hypothetical protein